MTSDNDGQGATNLLLLDSTGNGDHSEDAVELSNNDAEDTQQEDDDGEDNEEEVSPRPAKRLKSARSKINEKPTYTHCNINFTKNTQYPLLIGDIKKVWGQAKFLDPTPKVPEEKREEYKAGDYLLLK